MKWCERCVLPDTRPNLTIDREGICSACRAHERRLRLDWAARARAFKEVVSNTQQRSTGYDCVIPVSGGKDSTWQVVTCLEHGLNPLAVTWKTPARTEVGSANLANLVRLGVDHIDYQVNPEVEAAFMLRAFEEAGDPAIPMHLALFNIPLKIAARFGIPLVVWGENSALEYGGEGDEETGFRLDHEWLSTFGLTGHEVNNWISETLPARKLSAYRGPTADELEEAGMLAVFLGHYFRWDPQETFDVAAAHGFQVRAEGPKTGLYDFADIDDEFISVHHYLKWYKFGFTRLFDNLALEIRNGRITRSDAVEVIRRRGEEVPEKDIDAFCRFVGISQDRFLEISERFRNRDIWIKKEGRWFIPGFLIDDWEWA